MKELEDYYNSSITEENYNEYFQYIIKNIELNELEKVRLFKFIKSSIYNKNYIEMIQHLLIEEDDISFNYIKALINVSFIDIDKIPINIQNLIISKLAASIIINRNIILKHIYTQSDIEWLSKYLYIICEDFYKNQSITYDYLIQIGSFIENSIETEDINSEFISIINSYPINILMLFQVINYISKILEKGAVLE